MLLIIGALRQHSLVRVLRSFSFDFCRRFMEEETIPPENGILRSQMITVRSSFRNPVCFATFLDQIFINQ